MIPLKPLSAAAIARALEKAERYRLINQPWAAESICLDIVALDPDHQAARRALLLACTDQFGGEGASQAIDRARESLARLRSPYERAYYAGMIAERRAMARLHQKLPGAGFMAHDLLQEAMERYTEAEAIKPADNDDAVLRWNTCARLINESPHIVPRPPDERSEVLGE